MSETISIWYVKGLNKYLSERGFVHFYVDAPITEDSPEGRAYMINQNSKTFGLKDMINKDDAVSASKFADEFLLTGRLSVIEGIKE